MSGPNSNDSAASSSLPPSSSNNVWIGLNATVSMISDSTQITRGTCSPTARQKRIEPKAKIQVGPGQVGLGFWVCRWEKEQEELG
ncbi:hypothetical protein NL676_039271 [Syzygium grande]|nr:hypothetical protein NL676_039271 [Syzygium grande]